MLVKCSNRNSIAGVVDFIKTEWQAINPDLPFEQIENCKVKN